MGSQRGTPPQKAMDWDRLRIFHEVAKAGSLTRASERLGLSQSALSRQISALEEELKTPLFHRHARGLVLTEAGELLFRTAHEMDTRLAAARTRLMDARAKPSGPLRVTTTVGLGTIWLTPRMKEFIELYPDIRLTLLLDDEELDLAAREADVAIRLRRPVQPDLVQRKLFTVHHHIYAAPSYIKAHGFPRTLEELDRHRILSFGPAPSYLANVNWLTTVGRPPGNPREPVLTVNNVYGLRRAVEAGIGLASLPDYIVGPDSPLVQVDIRDVELPYFDTYLVYPQELRNSKRVRVFRDFIVAEARGWKF
jgi:DNA-binding transcriptional LysR family regulator